MHTHIYHTLRQTHTDTNRDIQMLYRETYNMAERTTNIHAYRDTYIHTYTYIQAIKIHTNTSQNTCIFLRHTQRDIHIQNHKRGNKTYRDTYIQTYILTYTTPDRQTYT